VGVKDLPESLLVHPSMLNHAVHRVKEVFLAYCLGAPHCSLGVENGPTNNILSDMDRVLT